MKSIITLFLIFGITPSFIQKEKSDIETTVRQFIKAADEQKPDALELTMHDEAMQYVLFGSKVLTTTKDQYVQQIKEKKLGGKPRTLKIQEIIISQKMVATVQFTATSTSLKFNYQISLVNLQGRWKISSINAFVQRI